jgi:two-component system, LytTR family, sensor kinase
MQKFVEWYLHFYPPHGTPLKRRIVIHITFWVVWGLFYILSFIAPSSLEHKFIITGYILIQGAIIFYSITYFVFPNLFSSKYFILGILFLIILYCLHYFLSFEFNKLVLKYTLFSKNGYKYAQTYVGRGLMGIFKPVNIFYEMNQLFSVVALPFMLKLSRVIIAYSMKMIKLTKEKTDLEIDFLRTQLNPHFLLNSLNNIYSNVYGKDQKTEDSVVLLSDLMKYMLYNKSDAMIPLQQEIDFIKQYIELEKLKEHKQLQIDFTVFGNTKDYEIAPLLLINFIENAFKHRDYTAHGVSTVGITVNLNDDIFLFNIKNDHFEKKSESIKAKGIGIQNTIKRLQILYPNRHWLNINTNNNVFAVDLKIQLS